MRVPRYYLNFKCIAARCTHSCCVGWEIDVDECTLARYRALDGEIGRDIQKSISEDGDGAHFCLGEGERCPHLDAQGLCRIITALGEGYLCDICREHPRFYHEIGGVWECGLGCACEEAARVVLAAADYADFVYIEKDSGAFTPETGEDFDAFACRSALYAALQAKQLPLGARLAQIERTYGLGVTLDRAEHRALFESLEYLDGAHRALLCEGYTAQLAPKGTLSAACERFFAYLILRHASPARDAAAFAAAVSLSHTLTRLFCALADTGLPHPTCARILSEELEYSTENTDALLAALQKKASKTE